MPNVKRRIGLAAWSLRRLCGSRPAARPPGRTAPAWPRPAGAAGRAYVADPGYAVDRGVYRAPDQPRNPDQPRYRPGTAHQEPPARQLSRQYRPAGHRTPSRTAARGNPRVAIRDDDCGPVSHLSSDTSPAGGPADRCGPQEAPPNSAASRARGRGVGVEQGRDRGGSRTGREQDRAGAGPGGKRDRAGSGTST